MTDLQYIKKIFSYVKPYAISYSIGTLMYTSQTFLFAFVSSIFGGALMTAILAGDFGGVMSAIYLMIGMVLPVMAIIGVGTYFYIMSVSYATRDLRAALFRVFTAKDQESGLHSGESMAAMNTDAGTASDFYSNAITPFLRNIIGGAFSAVAVFVIDYRMGLAAVAVGSIIFFAQTGLAKPLERIGKAQLEANAESVKSLSGILAGALAIRVFARQKRNHMLFDVENGKLKSLGFKRALIGMWQDLFTTFQGWLTLAMVFALGGYFVATGSMEFPQLMMLLPLAEAIGSSMSQIGESYAGLKPPIAAIKRVQGYLEADDASIISDASADSRKERATQEFPAWDGKYQLSVNGLNFKYKDASEQTLSDISLSVKENEMVAFVGASGSGKSTILKIITGLIERDSLPMKLGNLTFESRHLLAWRKMFAYVDQSCRLFDMTIAENIAMGRQGEAKEADIKEAAKEAHAHDFIMEMADGYGAACGEIGASLSGGQRQRIAIARALYRKAPVLVLDEITSALDSESESQVLAAIEDLRTNHTILMTTHNLKNSVSADRIVVIDGGHIVEIGTHDELMKKGGVYHGLFTKNLSS